jgi:hypothetical protein
MIKLKHILAECNECGRDWNHGHDHEAGMAKNELRDMISNASKIDQMIGESDNLPGWVSAYVSLAADYMHSVAEYLAGESSRAEEPGPGYAEVMYEGVDMRKVQAADDALRNLKRNLATNSNIPIAEKTGLLQALEELQEFVDEVGYDSEKEEEEYISDYSKRRAQEKGLYEAKKKLQREDKKVPTNYQFTPEQLNLFKSHGTKSSTSGNELYVPEIIQIELGRNKTDSKFKQEFYGTVPPSDQYLAAQMLTAVKKSMKDQVKIKDKKYFVLKGTITKNGNFNFPNPYRS